MSNLILIKRSTTTAIPASLANGEIAYTANGDILYIGSNTAIVAIGGKRTPGTLTANQALVANSTSYLDVIKTANLYIGSATVNTINAVANSTVLGAAGNNELTTTWAIKTYIDAKTGSILTLGDGLGSNSTHQFVKANNGIVANSTGTFVAGANGVSITAVGVNVLAGNTQLLSNSTGLWITQSNIDHNSLANFDSNKHIDHTAVTLTAGNGLTGGGTIAASRSFAVTAGVGIASNSTGVHVLAGDGIISNTIGTFVKAGTGVTVNATGVHIGQDVATTSNVTFNDVTVSGNLVVSGELVQVDVTNLTVEDSLIGLARNNSSTDAVDIGFFGLYDTSGSQDLYTGLFRDASDGKYRLFKDLQAAPTTTVNIGGTGYAQATLVAAIESSSATITGGSISGITDLAVTDGGTGLSSFTLNGVFYGATTGSIGFASGADGKVLTSVSGVPTFSDLDGGTF